MTTKKEKQQRREVFYQIVNSFLSGGFVFLGSLTTGQVTFEGVMCSLLTSAIVGFTQFKKYWESQESEYSNKLKLFNFIGTY